MKIKEKQELSKAVTGLVTKKKFKPKLYYMYKTGVYSQASVIAEDEADTLNTTLKPDSRQSVVVNIVDMVINQAVKALGISRDNKTAVMCEIDYHNKVFEVYFSTFDSKRTICTRIRSEHKGIPIP